MSFIKPNNINSAMNNGTKALSIVNRTIGTTINAPSSHNGVNKNYTTSNYHDAAMNLYDGDKNGFLMGISNITWGNHQYTVGS